MPHSQGPSNNSYPEPNQYKTYQMVILKAKFSSKLAYMCR